MDLRTLLPTLALATLLASSARAVEWKVIRVGERDYVSFANLAEFYQFGEYSHANRTISLQSAQRGLRAQVGTSQVYINGVRFFTHFPLREQAEGQLISAFDVSKLIEPILRPSRIQPAQKIETVVLDPGHGGTDSGTANRWGNEKTYTLEVALRAREQLLRAGFKVEMTRSDDTGISLENRIAFANKFPNSVFVSIHFNAGSGGNGVETYRLAPSGAPSNAATSGEHHAMENNNAAGDEGNAQDNLNISLAAAVHAAVLTLARPYDRGVRHARFKVLRHLRVPGLLLEAGFLNDPNEGQRIATPQYRQQLGDAIATGVQNYNAAVNYQADAPFTFAAVRANLPPHERSITEPLDARPPAVAPPPQKPSVSINGGE